MGDVEEIYHSDFEFRQLVDHSMHAIAVLEDHKVVYANKACMGLFKIKDLKEMQLDFFKFVHPDYHEICIQRIERVIQTHEIAENMEQKIIASDGEVIEVEVFSAPFFLNGRVLVQANYQDIRMKKQAEKLLNHTVKLKAVGEMAAGIAHEVRNPLTSVKGFLQLLKEVQPHGYIDIAMEELERALSTLNHLLQVSKPDTEEPYVLVDLNKEFDAVINLFQDQMYRIHVGKKYHHQTFPIHIKKNSFMKTIFNLLKNAFEAIDGEGKITIELLDKDGFANILIRDSGVGIPKDKIILLGTPFFSSKSEGTGMGLTQVFSTLEEHNGSIHVESDVGKGTLFLLQLPNRS